MLYVKRDTEGRIIALSNENPDDKLETVSSNDPEVIKFLTRSDPGTETFSFLKQSDLELIRVVEDVIELLVNKNLIMFTELPTAAQQKLMGRKRVRETLNQDSSLMIGKDEIL